MQSTGILDNRHICMKYEFSPPHLLMMDIVFSDLPAATLNISKTSHIFTFIGIVD
jgi:hypothetical protein